ncbi:toll/interleukin-1 receptor domain-containing protein [Bradyrhizobium canariense]|uniref:toll/interleukin-1 receptor domain-containing protein n=1 Tax=Bradyrhizobium canariense TaxID=255045 RepID=UPI001374738F|nr:toll/interleukin-1 receptor domain-containing protein [Bradyrhizobium canariense]
MPDVCILYARRDARRQAKTLAELVSRNWSVWWDGKLDAGDYRREIHRQISLAGCVVPIWSALAEFSDVLHDELSLAEKLGTPILPLRIQEVAAPLGFGNRQTTDAIGWTGEDASADALEHVDRISRILEARKTGVVRKTDLMLGNGLRLPSLFFSVSSYETRLSPGSAVDALNLFEAQTVLLSAYDFDPARTPPRGLLPAVKEMRSRGATVLLDSGNYEKARLSDRKWTLKKYHEALARVPHDAAFCFDEVNPPANPRMAIADLLKGIERDRRNTKQPIIPVVHLPRDRTGNYKTETAAAFMKEVARETRPPLLAIPERELGPGILERATAMRKIRETLNGLYFYQPVHILGTGNPVSIALLAAAGADTFDGLEWCRYVADGETKTLHHFQHYEFFRWQDAIALSAVTRKAAVDPEARYSARAVFHNLEFYTRWMEGLRLALQDGKQLVEFMTELLPKKTMTLARQALPGVL